MTTYRYKAMDILLYTYSLHLNYIQIATLLQTRFDHSD